MRKQWRVVVTLYPNGRTKSYPFLTHLEAYKYALTACPMDVHSIMITGPNGFSESI